MPIKQKLKYLQLSAPKTRIRAIRITQKKTRLKIRRAEGKNYTFTLVLRAALFSAQTWQRTPKL